MNGKPKKRISVTYLDSVAPEAETTLTPQELDALLREQPINICLDLGKFSQQQLWYAVNLALNTGHFAGASRHALERIRDELGYLDIEFEESR